MREKIIELLSDKDKPAKSAIELNDELGFVNIDEYKELQKNFKLKLNIDIKFSSSFKRIFYC